LADLSGPKNNKKLPEEYYSPSPPLRLLLVLVKTPLSSCDISFIGEVGDKKFCKRDNVIDRYTQDGKEIILMEFNLLRYYETS